MSLTVTVSQLNTYISSLFRGNDTFRNIYVRGEISGFVNHTRSGHFYFTLKDNGSSVKAVMFSRYAQSLRFMPENGMSVIVSANVEVFERDGVYQLYVSDIVPDGAGAVYAAIEQLKKKLSEEGLFSEKYKKPLPFFPKRIGIVTSREAAALQDILRIIERRCPAVEAVVFPCLVQGDRAPDSICDALGKADKSGCDVIICGRGGGSPEDLMAFNSEKVAFAIFDCITPVISAVGHETDTTIADLTADLRAPTPSAAAELAVPLLSNVRGNLSAVTAELMRTMERYILDKEQQLDGMDTSLKLCSPANGFSVLSDMIDIYEKRLKDSINALLDANENRIASDAAQLDSASPLKIMERGYSVVFRDNKAVSSSGELKKDDRIRIRFSDGECSAVVTEE